MPQRPRILIFVSELVIVLGNFFLIYFILRHFKALYHLNLIPFEDVVRGPRELKLYWNVFWAVVPIWAFLLGWRSGHQNLRVQSYRGAARNLLINGFLFLLFFASISFLLKFTFLSRLFIFLYTFSSTAWLILHRLIILKWSKEARRRGENVR